MLVVGLNQTIDRTIRLPALAPGDVLRAVDVAVTPGGKAVNVCRAALTLGAPARLVGPFPGGLGRVAVGMLDAEGLDVTRRAGRRRDPRHDGDHRAGRADDGDQRARSAARAPPSWRDVVDAVSAASATGLGRGDQRQRSARSRRRCPSPARSSSFTTAAAPSPSTSPASG